jgi:hypothetical protein
LSGPQNQDILRKFGACNPYDLNRDQQQIGMASPSVFLDVCRFDEAESPALLCFALLCFAFQANTPSRLDYSRAQRP